MAVLVIGFAIYAGVNFSENLTPYVSIAETTAAKNNVQVRGLLDKNFGPRQSEQEFLFSLRDEDTGETMKVKYFGVKPDRFEEAYHVVAIGKYEPTDETFHAKKLLIKCPSKYEGQNPK